MPKAIKLNNEDHMTFSPCSVIAYPSPLSSAASSPLPPPFTPPLPPAVSSPNVASSPPLVSITSTPHITSISNLRASISGGTSSLFQHPMVETSLVDSNLQAHKHAALANKLRLSKVLSPGLERSTLADLEDGRNDIRVLSPALVNSQVLSKTRPLSPSPPPIQQRNYNGTPDRSTDVKQESTEKSSNKGRGRGRRRPRLFKLKFHHQALPPEYLDHYEASLRQEQKNATAAAAASSTVPSPVLQVTDSMKSHDHSMGPREVIGGLQAGPRPNRGRGSRAGRNSRPITIHEAGGTTEALLRDLLLTRPHLQQQLQQAVLGRAQSVPSIMLAAAQSPRVQLNSIPQPSQSPDSSMGDIGPYQNEKYDSKPRKGRKSKKYELARLLSKGLSNASSMEAEINAHEFLKPVDCKPETTNDINDGHLAAQYATLERHALARSRSCSIVNSPLNTNIDQNEPLNLCVRDTPLPSEGCCTPVTNTPIIKIEPVMAGEDTTDSPLNNNSFPYESQSSISRGNRTPFTPPSDYPSWNLGSSLAPHWLHDYRLKTEDGLSSGHSTPSLCSQSSHLPSASPPVWPHLASSPPLMSPHSPSPAPMGSPMPLSPHHQRHFQALLKESLHNQLEEAARERLTPRQNVIGYSERLPHSPSRAGSARGNAHKSGARRKRSSVFIPPSDPNTEVSICKFKFTGGPNPMLEEKKMVSVDSGGNLRYFTGGDKGANRDQRMTPTHLSLSGKILENLSKCEKDVKKIRLESDNDDTCSLPGGPRSCHSATTSPVGTLERESSLVDSQEQQTEESPKRKRRSKKSSVREKLEQTLRETGLLIQTQQVESPEGATYCRFRQLRKITRYLFRSWKDYLPGQMPEGATGDPNMHMPERDRNYPPYDLPDNVYSPPHH